MTQDPSLPHIVEDPYTYDITDFAREFTWGLMFWNLAETQARQMLSRMLGGAVTAMAIVADMGNRSLLEGIKAASRELDDKVLRDHLDHFCSGFGVLLGYRNQYVHGLAGVQIGETTGMNRKLLGSLAQLKSRGRLRFINRTVEMSEIRNFLAHCKALSRYGSAIESELGMDDYGLREMLGMPPPSLEKPIWPSALRVTGSCLQG